MQALSGSPSDSCRSSLGRYRSSLGRYREKHSRSVRKWRSKQGALAEEFGMIAALDIRVHSRSTLLAVYLLASQWGARVYPYCFPGPKLSRLNRACMQVLVCIACVARMACLVARTGITMSRPPGLSAFSTPPKSHARPVPTPGHALYLKMQWTTQ